MRNLILMIIAMTLSSCVPTESKTKPKKKNEINCYSVTRPFSTLDIYICENDEVICYSIYNQASQCTFRYKPVRKPND